MKQILAIVTALLLAPLATLLAADVPQPPAKPNFLLIFADNLGY
jgi:hypothetical protein